MPVSKYSESISRIEKGLFGNGREGLLDRTTRLEEATKNISENVSTLSLSVQKTSESILLLSKGIEDLKDILDKHCQTPHLYVLMQKKVFWGGMLLAIILINTLTSYAPMAINALLTGLGIPFQLPIL